MKLYNLNPIGLGTEQVESFFSYMYRLAAAHGVSVNVLLERLRETEYKAAAKCNPNATTRTTPWSTLAMVRPNDSTLDVVALVNHYTNRTDLHATTFLAMRKLKCRSTSFFNSKICWCPCCFEEDIRYGNSAYFRLLWACKEVEYCHHHNVQLEHKCPHCKCKQHGTGRHYDLSKCRKCKKSLNDNPSSMSAANLANDICFRDLIALVCSVSSDPELLYEPMDSVNLIEQIFDKIWELREEREFWKLVPKDESLMMVTMNKPITVKKLRRLARRLGISFPGLLSGEAECWTAQLDPRWLSDLPSNMRPPKRRELVDRDDLLIRLTEVCKAIDTSKPPALAHVAKLVGVSTGGLEYLHPGIANEIKYRYQVWLTEERDRKYVEATAAVWKYLASDVQHKSRKHAIRTIMEDSGLPKNILREVIAEEWNTSNYS